MIEARLLTALERLKAERWIKGFLKVNPNPYGMCREATGRMVQDCPFLRAVAGMVIDGRWGLRPHAWLVAPDGEIFDPAASQFPALFEYDEGLTETGRCMDCGEILFNGKSFCGDGCEDSFRTYLKEERCQGENHATRSK